MIRSSNRFNFGKYRDQLVSEVARRDPGYIYFCENKMGHRFTPRVKRIARDARLDEQFFAQDRAWLSGHFY